ncbi:hypothetical protein MJ026_12785 [Acinetobacter ursingii]|uniref:hypothetical protein n=2 Tax=Acinetobacter ursingii TaxID=108980 RepID=UPI0022EB0116|nr:hypothetical protein [Acinetobacter ursingii]MDA3579949.1 hypothetical protein [Acinetobacter ursingii]MDH0808527.1 hypothetical protein [Acinetobacter ursingii]MDH2075534.1 hypothetical protein [Acinetobacter ursingii]
MLIIYGSFNIGGIETFFLRLAKERSLNNQKIKIIFTIPVAQAEYNQALLEELNKYAEVYHFEDIFCNIALNWRFHLFHKLNIDKLKKILIDIDHIHVCDSYSGILANDILNKMDIIKPITFGVYHTKEFSWGNNNLPYFENVNRKLVFSCSDSSNLICFSEDTKIILQNKINKKLENAQTFRLGVIDRDTPLVKNIRLNNSTLRICAVGRLADFKTYNLWMPEVIKRLRNRGVDIQFDIYGFGENEDKVKKNIIQYDPYVRLLPPFNYSKFNEIVSQYDMFIGSGTAIIQASSLGIPSIIGIESIDEPKTYGFFCDFFQYEYNVLGLDFDLMLVEDLIFDYTLIGDQEKLAVANKHRVASENFKISTCNQNFNIMEKNLLKSFDFNKYIYTISRLIFGIKLKLLKKSIYHDFFN